MLARLLALVCMSDARRLRAPPPRTGTFSSAAWSASTVDPETVSMSSPASLAVNPAVWAPATGDSRSDCLRIRGLERGALFSRLTRAVVAVAAAATKRLSSLLQKIKTKMFKQHPPVSKRTCARNSWEAGNVHADPAEGRAAAGAKCVHKRLFNQAKAAKNVRNVVEAAHFAFSLVLLALPKQRIGRILQIHQLALYDTE